MHYRREIDGLRALAVLPVILFHAGVQVFSGGFVGVDVFFVISGYLITALILAERQAGTFSLGNFYARRARRILPALFVMMLTCIPLAWLLLSPAEMKGFYKALVAATFFSANIFFGRGGGYFDAASELNPLLHTWSLGVEEQYYLFFPLLLGLISSWSGQNKIRLLFLLSILSLGAAHLGASYMPTQTFYLLPTRAWELFVGVFAAAYLHHNPNYRQRYSVPLRQFAGLSGIGLVGISIFVFDKNTPFPSLYALAPTLGAALIIVFGTANTWIGRTLSTRPLVGIGLISYSAYLWHQPLFVFARHANNGSNSNLLLIGLILFSFVLGFLSWKHIETPFRNNRFSPKVSLVLAGLFVVIFLLFAVLGRLNSGYAERFPALQKFEAETAWPESFNLNPGCANKYGGDQYCQIHHLKAKVTDALIGDSHANHFYFGLAKHLHGNGRNLIQQGAGGCPPLLGIDIGKHPEHGALQCHERMGQVYSAILRNPDIQTVYLAFHHAEYFRVDVPMRDMQGELLNSINRDTFLQAALLRTIKTLELNGKKVVLLYDMPDLIKGEPARCLMRADRNNVKDDCQMALAFKQNFDQYNKLLEYVQAQTALQVFDTRPYLTNFPKSPEGDWLYRDATHLSVKGSLFFSDKYSVK